MWRTNLKIVAVVLGTLGLYTLIANKIPQIQSEVPQSLSFGANVTPDQLVAAGEKLFNGAGGCTACHGMGTRAPNLLTDEKGAGMASTVAWLSPLTIGLAICPRPSTPIFLAISSC